MRKSVFEPWMPLLQDLLPNWANQDRSRFSNKLAKFGDLRA